MRRRLALAALLALGAAAAGAAADDRPGGRPPGKMRFVQRAESGTLRWQGGKLVLRLRGVPTTSTWLERRPGGERRRIQNQHLIERIIAHPRLRSAGARLRAARPGGRVTVVPLRLLDGDWDIRRGAAVYRAEPVRQARPLPRRFGPATLVGEVDPTRHGPPTGCVGVECAARNIAELIEWAYNFFTHRPRPRLHDRRPPGLARLLLGPWRRPPGGRGLRVPEAEPAPLQRQPLGIGAAAAQGSGSQSQARFEVRLSWSR